MSDTAKLLAAADLADRYIETILSTQPDLLVGDIVDCDSSEVGALAERLAHYREALINELQGQPLPAGQGMDNLQLAAQALSLPTQAASTLDALLASWIPHWQQRYP